MNHNKLIAPFYTYHDSKVENKIDVETPPSIRPVINHQKLGDNFVRADAAYIIVKAKAILLKIDTVEDI